MNRIVAILIVTALAVALPAKADFFWGTDGPVSLRCDSNRIVMKFDRTFSPAFHTALLLQLASVLEVVPDEHPGAGFVLCSLLTPRATESLADSLRAIDGVALAEPVYLAPNDSALFVNETFVVAFSTNVSRSTIDSICLARHALIRQEMPGMPNVFLLANTRQSGMRLYELANSFHIPQTPAFAHPNFHCPISKSAYTVLDYYHTEQLHSKKVIGAFNSASVWDFAGLTRSVTVAVIDDGINWQLRVHNDLPATRILEGWDFNASSDTSDSNWWDSDPAPGAEQAHGMGCGGIIAAAHTTDSTEFDTLWQASGVFGINPHASILPVKIFNEDGNAGSATEWDLAASIIFAYDRAEILSNSWGFGDPNLGRWFPLLDSVLHQAPIVGRGGKGCPVIFSAGNYGSSWVQYPAHLPGCFAVGATQLNDSLFDYSQHDSTLDVVAPSGNTGLYGDVWTLDQIWGWGFNPSYSGNPKWPFTWQCGNLNNEDLDCRFGGTSAACPVASGVASLVLARDSMLTVYEVYDILRHSAVSIGSPTPNSYYGYGRVDAFRAVLSIARGDVDNDAAIDISDLVALIDYLMIEPYPAPFPTPKLGDCDCDGLVDASDIQYLIDYVILGTGPAPVKPCFKF